jgi:two-component system, NarL family, nitrate/nitrite response regulator NarL
VVVCLVSRSNLFRSGLKFVLQNSEFSVDDEVASLLDVAKRNSPPPDILLVQQPDDLADFHRQVAFLKASEPSPLVILLARSMNLPQIAECMSCGVDGYLLEDISAEALRQSIHLVTLGEKVYPSQLVQFMAAKALAWERHHPQPESPLSEREIDVVELLTEGASNKLIAERLDISEATVKVHIKTILKKIGVRNRTQAAIWGIHRGLACAEDPDMLPIASLDATGRDDATLGLPRHS